MSPPSRRDVLRACGVSVTAVAGCAGPDDSPDATTSETTRTATRTTTQMTEETTEQTTSETTTEDSTECAPTPLSKGWPLPDRGPANANYAPSATGATQKPRIRWEQRAKPNKNVVAYFTDPVVTSDRVFVGKRYLPGAEREMPDDNAVHAYDRASGERVWASPMGTEAPETVAVTADTVYAAAEGALHAVARRDGTRRWRFAPEENIEGVVPTDGRIYVATGWWSDSESRVGGVTALRPDGTEEWTSSVGRWASARPVVHEGRVFAGTHEGTLTALGAADGRERWSKSLGKSGPDNYRTVDGIAASACVLFANVDGDVVALSFDGSVRWRTPGDCRALSTDGASAYVGTGDGTLRALSTGDGAVEWEVSLRGGVSGIYDDPAVSGETLLVSGVPDSLHALDAASGTERWRQTFDYPGDLGKPVVVDEELFLSLGRELLVLT